MVVFVRIAGSSSTYREQIVDFINFRKGKTRKIVHFPSQLSFPTH